MEIQSALGGKLDHFVVSHHCLPDASLVFDVPQSSLNLARGNWS